MATLPIRNRSRLDGSLVQPKTKAQHSIGRIAQIVLSLLLLSVVAAAADDLTPAVVYHPGDVIHVVFSFNDTGATFDSMWTRFVLQGQRHDGQKAFNAFLDLSQLTPLPGHQYELSGTIPDQLASGDYVLNVVTGSAHGLNREYDFGTDFQTKILIHIENPKRIDFPELKGITLKP